jgi:hypothetical protein
MRPTTTFSLAAVANAEWIGNTLTATARLRNSEEIDDG